MANNEDGSGVYRVGSLVRLRDGSEVEIERLEGAFAWVVLEEGRAPVRVEQWVIVDVLLW